jgi:uncharacterized protein YciI
MIGWMSPRFAYFYLMGDHPDRVRAAVPEHVSHWRNLQLPSYLGGPFEDRTGGLITFEAESAERAQHAVDTDPFVREGLLEAYWIKGWAPE